MKITDEQFNFIIKAVLSEQKLSNDKFDEIKKLVIEGYNKPPSKRIIFPSFKLVPPGTVRDKCSSEKAAVLTALILISEEEYWIREYENWYEDFYLKSDKSLHYGYKRK